MDDDEVQTTCEGMGPEEPPEVLERPENVAAADAIRAASILELANEGATDDEVRARAEGLEER